MTCACNKCGRSMDEGQFYTYKDGSKTELCKKAAGASSITAGDKPPPYNVSTSYAFRKKMV